MQQLSAHDAAFLDGDTAHSNANVSLLHIYDQSTAPGGRVRFKTILAHIESRLGASPVFRRKLLRVPLGLDRPYWVEDEHFDLEYHVRHIALPKPGDWRQFCIQASRIHARPLDLARPLWEIYVIEGLDSFLDLPVGSFALLTKTHHAAVDVERDGELTMLLHDLAAAPAAAPPPAPWFPEPAPGRLPLLARGVVRNLSSPRRLSHTVVHAVRRLAPDALALAGELLLRGDSMPLTRFNSIVSPHRVFETRRFGLDEFRRIRERVRGASVNDVVLAVCGGALRAYLDGHDELPAQTLTALSPVSVRGDDGTPQVSWLHVALGTDIEDPLERLRAVHAQTASSEVMARALGAREQARQGRHGSGAMIARTSKLLGQLAAGRREPLANCSITHVPGPDVPLYLCGARMTYFSAMLPLSDGMGLVFAVTTYDGRVIISPTSCRELMPDPERFASCLRESFQALLAQALAASPASPPGPGRRRRKSDPQRVARRGGSDRSEQRRVP